MPLPKADEPLKLADGSIVHPNGRVDQPTQQFIEVPSNTEAQRLIVNARRKLSDLPDMPRTMNAVSVVLAYTLFGVSDIEIAIATGMSEDQVGRIKMNESYSMMHDSIIQSIMTAETDTVRSMFQQHAREAATVMVDGLRMGSRGDKMAAAKDLLDRAGHRPADVVEHRHRMEAGLTIEVIRKDQTERIPVIEMETE